MKNFFLIFSIIFLIISTALIKNSSKKLENQIYNIRENLSILSNKYDYIFLENNYLSSPQKLIEHKNTILSENYISLNISNIKILQENDGLITIKKFNKDE